MENWFMKNIRDFGYILKYLKELNLFFDGLQSVTGWLQGGADIRRGGAVVTVI